KSPSASTIARFDYTYDSGRRAVGWLQQTPAGAVSWEYAYDEADQLIDAVKSSTDAVPTTLGRFAYQYDTSCNRTPEQIDDAVRSATYDNMKRIVSEQSSGALRVEGTVSEPANVTVAGRAVEVSASNRFAGVT